MPLHLHDDSIIEDSIPRKVIPLVFMIDTSGSMIGSKIAAVNAAVFEFLEDCREIIIHTTYDHIKVAVLEFSTEVTWMYDQLSEAESFQWQDLTAAGLTSFGAACEELNQKLSQSHDWMSELTGTCAPAIILLTDDEPTDEWKHALEKLKGNQWFKVACKVAIAIGDDADKAILADFTGNKESVITVHNVEQLKKIIHAVSVTSSMVNSKSSSVGGNTFSNGTPTPIADPTQQVVEVIKNIVDMDPTLTGVDMGASIVNVGTDDWF